MNDTVLIQGDKGQLRFKVLDYENRQAKTVDDSNWLEAELNVVAGPFEGAIRIALTTVELEMFYQQLARVTQNLTGNVMFESMEGNLRINVGFSRTGEVLVQGDVTPDESEQNKLHYQFRTDPITLDRVIQDLERIVSRFPVKHSIETWVD